MVARPCLEPVRVDGAAAAARRPSDDRGALVVRLEGADLRAGPGAPGLPFRLEGRPVLRRVEGRQEIAVGPDRGADEILRGGGEDRLALRRVGVQQLRPGPAQPCSAAASFQPRFTASSNPMFTP